MEGVCIWVVVSNGQRLPENILYLRLRQAVRDLLEFCNGNRMAEDKENEETGHCSKPENSAPWENATTVLHRVE